MTIGIAILAVLAAMVLAGLILWQRQTSAQLKIMKTMERQIQMSRQELETLSQKVGETADSCQKMAARQKPESESAEPEGQPLEERASINGETAGENIEQISETETRSGGPSEKERLALERLEAEITQSLEAVAAAEKSVAKQAQKTDENGGNVEMDELESHIWSQLVELAEQEEQEQKAQGKSADDEKLIDSDQAGEKPGPSGYNVGKSGKIYTEEELELLIKE